MRGKERRKNDFVPVSVSASTLSSVGEINGENGFLAFHTLNTRLVCVRNSDTGY